MGIDLELSFRNKEVTNFFDLNLQGPTHIYLGDVKQLIMTVKMIW